MGTMPNNSLARHWREIAKRFLLTAVFVDDDLALTPDPPPNGGLVKPGRGAAGHAQPSAGQPPSISRPLRVDPITASFVREGMICGVVSPQNGQSDNGSFARTVARADIVILDWLLDPENNKTALPLLEQILEEGRPHRLRLIAIYTGQPDLNAILERVAAALPRPVVAYPPVSTDGARRPAIESGACNIVVYAKPYTQAPGPSAVIVQEKDLASRLIDDFAGMARGLLPSLVLTALAAVRENAYQVLGRFGRDLDPAFLTHRACLPQPADAEQHIGEQIASELNGIIDDVITRDSPAGMDVIAQWLRDRFGGKELEFSERKKMSQEVAVAMLTHGVENEHGTLKQGGKDYGLLSGGFAGSIQNGRELDRRLASAMSFRQVLADSQRQLSMGTVIRRIADDGATLLCVTPKCDSVRLEKESAFLFVPLSSPKSKTLQVVVPADDNKHQRMTIPMKPAQWCIRKFEPDEERQCVLAGRDGPNSAFMFKDTSDAEYRWVGELKAEFAQSIALKIAETMSRMPLNKSEWLRRSEGVGKR